MDVLQATLDQYYSEVGLLSELRVKEMWRFSPNCTVSISHVEGTSLNDENEENQCFGLQQHRTIVTVRWDCLESLQRGGTLCNEYNKDK